MPAPSTPTPFATRPPATALPRQDSPPVGRLEYLPAAVLDLLTHYVEPALRPRLSAPAGDLRLAEDLGLDSLSMMEVMMRVEDWLQISIGDQELRQFRTVGDVRSYIERSIPGGPVPAPAAPGADFAAN